MLKELLSWIDRVDRASQVPGSPRPPCRRLDGTPIFPEEGSENDLWWLSEIAKRKRPEDEEQKHPEGGDEDGPVTSEAEAEREKEDADETDDTDESSSSSKGATLHPTMPADSPSYAGHFERQRQARCAIHAPNLVTSCLRPFRFCLYRRCWRPP